MSVNDREWSLGLSDSLLSHKECFQSLPTSTGTKRVLDFHLSESTRAAPTKEKFPAVGSHSGDMARREVKTAGCCSKFQAIFQQRSCLTNRGNLDIIVTPMERLSGGSHGD